MLDHQGLLVKTESMEEMAYLEQMVNLVLMLSLMQCPQLKTSALTVLQGRQDHLEDQAPKDLMAIQELTENPDLMDNRVYLVHLVHKDLLVPTESQASLASKGNPALLRRYPFQMDPLDLQDHLDHLARTEGREHLASLGKTDLKDHLETLDEMVLQEIQVFLENKE